MAKFIKFYNITGNDLANLVRNDLDEALLYIALSETQKPEKIISVEDSLGL